MLRSNEKQDQQIVVFNRHEKKGGEVYNTSIFGKELGKMGEMEGVGQTLMGKMGADNEDDQDKDENIVSGKGDDKENLSLREKFRKHKAEKHIKEGNDIVMNNPDYYYQLPTKGNKNGVALKLKRKWVKEKFWPYYAEWLKENYGYEISSYEDFLKLDKNPNDEYFDVPGYAGGQSTDDGKINTDQNKKEEIKTEEDVKKEDIKVQDEPKKDEVVKQKDPNVIKITQYDEKKVVITHHNAPVAIVNNYEKGGNVDATVALDPGEVYVVYVRGATAKDQVSVYVNGKWVDGDPRPKSLRRVYHIPEGSDSVRVFGEISGPGSILEIEIQLDEQTEITYWKTYEKTYYADGHTTTKEISSRQDEPVIKPFTKIPILNPFMPEGPERVIWEAGK